MDGVFRRHIQRVSRDVDTVLLSSPILSEVEGGAPAYGWHARFADAEWHATEGGAVLIEQAALWLECSIHAVFDGGDHEIVLLKVLESNFFPEVEPLVFHQSEFRGLQIQ
jgi:flavin reductase (DIM6/NTAB) family NADH-FMN oxidoreductase RutF